MRLALLQCDHVGQPFRHITGGDYDHVFRQHFAQFADGVLIEAFDVTVGDYPAVTDDFDGYLTSGSKYSVYDDEPWVNELKLYVQQLYAAQKKFVGICFGHQMIAEALGGRVAKSPNGWGIGVHQFPIQQQADWMTPSLDSYNVMMSCQDQVQVLPEGSTVLAGNEFCPVAMYQVGQHFLGIQGHPEFTPPYAEALMDARSDRIPAETIQAAKQTLTRPLHQQALTDWIINFIARDV